MGESGNCSATKRILKNLCITHGWSYGVFWGFDHRNPMLLTMEDAYYEERLGSYIDNILVKVHMLGEGTIGQAALNGKHQWILADGCGRERNSFRSSESKTTFQTIVAIPVEPRGVVQFGSTEKIGERLEFVDQTIRLFREDHDTSALHPLENLHSSSKVEYDDITALFSNTNIYTACFGQNSSHFEKTFQRSNFPERSDFVDIASCSDTWGCEFVDLGVDSRFFQDSSDAIHSKGNSLEGNVQGHSVFSSWNGSGSLTETENHFQAGSGNVMDDRQSLHSVFDELLEDFKRDEFATDLFNLCQADDLSQWLASLPDQSTNPMVNSLSGDLTQLVESTSTYCVAGGKIEVEDRTNLVQEKSVVVQSTEKVTSDAQKFKGQFGQSVESWEDIIIPLVNGNYPTTSSAPLKCHPGLNSTAMSGPRKGLFSEAGLEELLAGTSSSSCLTSSNLEDQSCSAKRRRIESASSSGNASFSHINAEKSNNLVTKKELPKSQVGLWIDDSYSITPASTVLSSKQQKSDEHKTVVRKRARPGESTRPRPKDRQLIQDRIKELRGIIPNSGKCSIDSLLERTIKYMVFLQGVTKHGDKLRQPTTPKLIGSENGVVLRDKNNMSGGGGATWAYEVGGQSAVCPIIVEDLSPPGQMLIEMLCEEQGFFLEIADIIRGFGLSILKGIMEVREEKIWAHFIVEAKSHITRIDVFWSLVRLLQRTSTGTINSDKQPFNAVLDGGIPLVESYQKPNLPQPICLTERLH